MLKILIVGAVALISSGSLAEAQTCSAYTYTLMNGQTADASQVMSNFNSILLCANNNLAPLASPAFAGGVNINSGSVNSLTLSATSPTVAFYATGGGADQKRWDMFGNSSSMTFRAINDAYSAANIWLSVSRPSSFSIGSVTFPSLPVYAASFTSTSDARLKANIQPISYGLSALMRLKPVSFDWIKPQNTRSQHEIGLVAQDVQKVLPEAVSESDDDFHTLGIAYGSVIPVLIKSIQELKNENDVLAARVKALEIQSPGRSSN